MHFEFGDKKHVQYAEAVVLLMRDDSTTRRRIGKKLGMIDTKRPAVAHMDGKWPKRTSTMNIFKLFNGHNVILHLIFRTTSFSLQKYRKSNNNRQIKQQGAPRRKPGGWLSLSSTTLESGFAASRTVPVLYQLTSTGNPRNSPLRVFRQTTQTPPPERSVKNQNGTATCNL